MMALSLSCEGQIAPQPYSHIVFAIPTLVSEKIPPGILVTMISSPVDCIYRELHDGTSADEAVPSEEHVLSEALGGSFKLPKNRVCKACNNRLNSRVEMPTTKVFRGLLNIFQIQASKHGIRDNAVPVVVNADGKPMQARLLANGSFHPVSGPTTEEPILAEDGELQWMFRARDMEEAQQMIKGLSRTYSWKEVKIESHELKSLHIKELPIAGKFEHIYRAAAKTALNYLIWRRPNFAHDPCLAEVKRFIINGLVSGTHPHLATTPELIEGGPISPQGLTPMHQIAVGGEGPILRSSVVLFGKFCFEVHLSKTFIGESFHLEHAFDLTSGKHRIVDFWAVHPNAFQGELARNARSRIRYGEFPMDRWHFLHEVSVSDDWVRCAVCSSEASPKPPTRDETLRCHQAVTRSP
jgi:hypothetical protein